ncbi:ankyrin repeat domain-containing protein [Candidatus Riflebacteria bacterium]
MGKNLNDSKTQKDNVFAIIEEIKKNTKSSFLKKVLSDIEDFYPITADYPTYDFLLHFLGKIEEKMGFFPGCRCPSRYHYCGNCFPGFLEKFGPKEVKKTKLTGISLIAKKLLAGLPPLNKIEKKSKKYFDYPIDLHPSLLHSSASIGDLNLVKTLLECGANINYSPFIGVSPLNFAIKFGHVKVVKYLLDRKAKIETRELSALVHAILKGDMKLFKVILEFDPDLNFIGEQTPPPLEATIHLADSYSSEDSKMAMALKMTKMLIEKDADVSLKNNSGQTALDIAKAKGMEKFISLLQKKDPKQ